MDLKALAVKMSLVDKFVSYGIKIILIFVTIAIIFKLLDIFFRKLSNVNITDREQHKKVKTIYSILNSTIKIIVSLIGLMFVLQILNVNIAPILATAGVLGIAVGFGSQRLVEDVFSGLNIILTNQIRVGDTVKIDNITGIVERITVNTVILRDFSGVVHFIRNGNINIISNMTKDFSYYLTTIGISYNQNIDEVFDVIRQVGKTMQSDAKYQAYILSDIEILGVDGFEESTVSIMIRIKTLPSMQWLIGREFNKRIKETFDEKGIEFPFPQRTIHIESEK
jgi:small conductance mechanosensitive channel